MRPVSFTYLFFVLIVLTSLSWARPMEDGDKKGLTFTLHVDTTEGGVKEGAVDIPLDPCLKEDGGEGTAKHVKITISGVKVVDKTVKIPVLTEHDMVLTFTPTAKCENGLFQLFLKGADGKEILLVHGDIGKLEKDKPATVQGESNANDVKEGTKGKLIFKVTCGKAVVLCRTTGVKVKPVGAMK